MLVEYIKTMTKIKWPTKKTLPDVICCKCLKWKLCHAMHRSFD